MKRYLLKLMVYLVLFAGLGNYLIYLTTGRMLLSEIWHRNVKIPTSLPSPSLPTVELPKLSKLTGHDDAHKAFKWTDSNGIIHYADQPPDGQDAKLINMDPDQNLVQGSPPAPPPPAKSSKQKKPIDGDIDSVDKPYQIDQAKLEAIKQKLLESQSINPAADY